MAQVLHITTHMGGGVGKVLSSIATFAKESSCHYQHKILLLEPPEKNNFIDICKHHGIEVVLAPNMKVIEEEMGAADIVQLEWWHHPKMAHFLYAFPQIPIKLVVWSHISGCTYPVLPFEFVTAPQRFLFTSQYSWENPYWNQEQINYARSHTEVVNSAGGYGYINRVAECHQGFNIGYAGTLSYSKLHPEFIDFCAAVEVPEAKFILVGDTENQANIACSAQAKGILDKLEFTGYSPDIGKEFARFDIFAYPLNPQHFGTTENVLLEAMAAGLPVVALNQSAERYIIKHGKTGFLANNIHEYAEFIKYLYENPSERRRIGENAKQFVLQELSVEKTVAKLNANYDTVLNKAKKVFNFAEIFGDSPSQWFLSCLGNERQDFAASLNMDIMKDKVKANQIEANIRNCRLILKELSKSSVFQFARYFPQDISLQYWASLISDKSPKA